MTRTRQVFLAHVIAIALAGLGTWILEIPVAHLGYGAVIGVAIYSLYWRIMYGHWPD